MQTHKGVHLLRVQGFTVACHKILLVCREEGLAVFGVACGPEVEWQRSVKGAAK